MFINFDTQTRQLLIGNFSLIICCAFYILWWIIAFKPEGAVKGLKSGWLLVPAFVFGIAAIILIVMGSNGIARADLLIPKAVILLVGLAAYIILLIVTSVVMKRQVTTELLLIVGWTVIAFLELNALYGKGEFSNVAAIIFMVLVVVAAAIGIVCYLLYYGLDVRTGYVDGMIPLLLVIGMMAAISVGILRSGLHG